MKLSASFCKHRKKLILFINTANLLEEILLNNIKICQQIFYNNNL